MPSVLLERKRFGNARKTEGDMFLDDVTLDELSEKLKIKIIPVPNNGKDFIQAILGRQA